MQIIDLLTPKRVQVDVVVKSKKRLLELLADLLDDPDTGAKSRAIYTSLCKRERIGSTALGHGVAIPHARLPEAIKATGAFVRLRDPIDFDAPDRSKVDLVFALVVPENNASDHLELLAQLAQLFSDEERRDDLRRFDSGEVYAMLGEWHGAQTTG